MLVGRPFQLKTIMENVTENFEEELKLHSSCSFSRLYFRFYGVAYQFPIHVGTSLNHWQMRRTKAVQTAKHDISKCGSVFPFKNKNGKSPYAAKILVGDRSFRRKHLPNQNAVRRSSRCHSCLIWRRRHIKHSLLMLMELCDRH